MRFLLKYLLRVNKTKSREEEATIGFSDDDQDNDDDQVNNNHQSYVSKRNVSFSSASSVKREREAQNGGEKGSVSLVFLFPSCSLDVNVDRIPFSGRKKRK